MSDFPPPCTGTSTKGTVHRKVEQLVNGHPQEREALLAALKDPMQDYVDILKRLAGVTEAEADRLCETWYHPQCIWWPAHHPIEPIVRQSLIKALELAGPENLDIDSYWLCAGDQFQAMVTRNNRKVIRLILTPPPAFDPAQSEPLWIFRKGTVSEVSFI